MVKVGIAGIGFMGWIHWLAYQQIEGVEVVAICETDEKRRSGDWTGIQGNFGPAGQDVDLSQIATYGDLDQMCEHDFDMLDVCLPPSFHTLAIEKGLGAGKHVFCEKPLSLLEKECDQVVEKAASANRMLMVGHVLPYFPEYKFARAAVESGDYGNLIGGHFKRIISDPTWLPDFFNAEKIGGPLLDLHVHDAHFIRLIAGMPKGVYSSGQTKNNLVSFCHSIFDFEDRPISIASSGGIINQQGRPFTHGFEIQLEKATLHFEYAALESGDQLMPLKVIKPDGTVELIDVGDGDPVNAFVAEIRDVVGALTTNTALESLSGAMARDAIKICHAESKSVMSGQRIEL